MGPKYVTLDLSPFEYPARKRDIPQRAPPFSGVKCEHLTQLDIDGRGLLQLKSDYETRAAAMDILGAVEHRSSDGLYHHLKTFPLERSMYTKDDISH